MAENDGMHAPLAIPESGEADIRTRALIGAVAAFGVSVILAGIAAWFLVEHWAGTLTQPEPPARPVAVAGPPLQISPSRDMAELRANEDRIMNETAWIDRANGIARIPVEKAMDLMVRRAGPAPQAPGSGH